MFTSACFVLDAWKKCGVEAESDMGELYQKYVAFFLEQTMAKHMSGGEERE